MIQTMDDLEKAMLPTLTKMTDQLATQVYETLNYFLNDYYTGWTPKVYQRTMDFLHSAVKVKAKPYRTGVKAVVYIDHNSMDDYKEVSGIQVVEWANTGLHGGIIVRHKPHVWDDTIKNTVTNGALIRTAEKYLRSKGFTVSRM